MLRSNAQIQFSIFSHLSNHAHCVHITIKSMCHRIAHQDDSRWRETTKNPFPISLFESHVKTIAHYVQYGADATMQIRLHVCVYHIWMAFGRVSHALQFIFVQVTAMYSIHWPFIALPPSTFPTQTHHHQRRHRLKRCDIPHRHRQQWTIQWGLNWNSTLY